MTESYDVAHITSVHSLNDTRILLKECVSLFNAGVRVVLIGPQGTDADALVATGVPTIGLVLPRRRLARMFIAPFKIFASYMSTGARVAHLHDPELVPLGILLRVLGHTVIYDAHEDLPKQLESKAWIPRYLRPLLRIVLRGLERTAGIVFNFVVAATPSIARQYPLRKTTTVENFPLLGELADASSHTEDTAKRRDVVYIGSLSEARGARTLILAMSHVQADVVLRVVGTVHPPSLKRELQELPGADRVHFVGQAGREEVRERLSTAFAGVVVFKNLPNHTEAQPNKMFEYMSASVPVIASNFEYWKQIIEGSQCGLLVDEESPTDLARAIDCLASSSALVQRFGNNGFTAVKERYNWHSQQGKLFNLYEAIGIKMEPHA